MRKERLLVKHGMTLNPATVTLGTTIGQAMQLLIDGGISGLPVLDEKEKPIGIVSRTDLMHAYNLRLEPQTAVDVVMSDKIISIAETETLEHASLVLLENEIGHLLVMTSRGKLAGILTQSDVMRKMTDHLGIVNGQLKAVVSSVPDGLVVADTEGIVIYTNPEFTKITGWQKESVNGKFLTELFPGINLEDAGRKALRGIQLQLSDAAVLLTVSPVMHEADKRGYVAICKDVTDFHKMKEEITSLNEINENLHAIFSSINEGIHAINKDGINIFYNETAAKLDGLDVREVLGRSVLDCFPSLTEQTSTLINVARSGKPVLNAQQTFKNMKGQPVTTINSTIPLRLHGKLIGAMEVSHDITQVRRLSEKVLDLQTELYRSEFRRKGGGDEEPPCGGAIYNFDDIIGNCEAILRLKYMAYRASQSASSVLVHGETGTGKELVVHAIHNASRRKNNPFIPQNCAALPESLLEGILFGTVKGGFTGAEDRPGLFELASGGTLFLDEINSMNLSLQAKLLRALQEGVIRRVADTKVRPVDVRVIAATNIDPLLAVEEGKLRADLYYRLNVVSLRIPPLRERQADIPVLTRHFLERYNHVLHTQVKEIAGEVDNMFLNHCWPGNVRELEHIIEGALNIIDGEVLMPKHLPEVFFLQMGISPQEYAGGNFTIPECNHLPPAGRIQASSGIAVKSLRDAMEVAEENLIRQAMQDADWNISQAARLLDVPRQTLQYKLRTLNITE